MEKYEIRMVAICEKTVTVYAEHETAATKMMEKMYRDTDALDFTKADMVDMTFSRRRERDDLDYIKECKEAGVSDDESSGKFDLMDIEWI